MKMRSAFIVAALVATGCYVDGVDSRKPTAPEKSTKGAHKLTGSCRLNDDTGCIEGYAPAAPKVSVDGKEFHDVNEMRQNFCELIKLQNKKGEAISAAECDKRISWVTAIDNDNFATGMTAYFKNSTAGSTSVMQNGKFYVHELPSDQYFLRIEKPIQFQVRHQETFVKPEADATMKPDEASRKLTESTVDVVNTYCATLYADTSADIRAGEVTKLVVDRYNLRLVNKTCADAASNRIITE